jgi:hypothetical protein
MSRVNLRPLCILALALAGAATPARVRAQADESLPQATVHFVLFEPFGGRIPEAQIHLLSRDRKSDLVPHANATVITGVPYGGYTVSAWDKGGGIAEREITVNTKDVWVHLAVPFPTFERAWPAGDLTITGEVSPPPTNGDWWVRAEGVVLNVSREAPIPRGGLFTIGGLEMGTYLVEVFDGAKLRRVETVEVHAKQPNTRLRISLAAGPP